MLLAEMAQKISGKVVVREKLGNSITKFSKFLNRKTNKTSKMSITLKVRTNNPKQQSKALLLKTLSKGGKSISVSTTLEGLGSSQCHESKHRHS